MLYVGNIGSGTNESPNGQRNDRLCSATPGFSAAYSKGAPKVVDLTGTGVVAGGAEFAGLSKFDRCGYDAGEDSLVVPDALNTLLVREH